VAHRSRSVLDICLPRQDIETTGSAFCNSTRALSRIKQIFEEEDMWKVNNETFDVFGSLSHTVEDGNLVTNRVGETEVHIAHVKRIDEDKFTGVVCGFSDYAGKFTGLNYLQPVVFQTQHVFVVIT
jgi:hypothetical protein